MSAPGQTGLDPFAAYRRALAGRDVDSATKCFTHDASVRVDGAPHVSFVGDFVGHREIREFFEALFTKTEPDPDFLPPSTEVVEQGDHIVIFSSFRHLVRATGRYYDGDFALHCVFHDGLIARYQIYENTWSVGQAFDPR